MFLLPHAKNWHVIGVVRAIELKSDLRLYKHEKEIVRDVNGVDKEDEVNHAESRRSSPKKIFDFLPSARYTKAVEDPVTQDLTIYRRLVRDGTTENFVLKSAIGFSGGLLLTYICYLFLIYSLNFTLNRATLICMALGIVLSLGLAFSIKTRCTVLLCLPQLFSKRGRQALLAYAFILALSGPAKNTLHNVEVMSESLACGQEQLKRAENEMVKCVHRPNAAVKQSLDVMLEKLDNALAGYKTFIEKFYKESYSVKTVISAQEWLYSISVLCNRKMGSPFGRCTDLLFEAERNCKSVSQSLDWIKACSVVPYQDCICATEDSPFCSVEDLPPFWPFLNHRKHLNEFMNEAMNVIYAKVESRQVFTQPNRTAAFREEYQGMATEIRQKTDRFLQYFDLMSVIFGIFIIVLFIKVIIYRYKFLTEDEYDNRFITRDFVDIDRTRAEFGMQTVLPLEQREQKKYIKVSSMRLAPYERTRLVSTFIFLVFATFKIIIHILTDSSLYWMLSTMRRHGRMLLINRDADVPQVTVTVNGTGIYAQLLRNVTDTVRPYAVQRILDPIPCLPDPISPDWNRYCQILTLVVICWMLAVIEPYGLRLRHIVMVTYHPDRARERAIWLYNRILTTRINFVKFARRQIRRKYKDMDEDIFYRKHFWIIKRKMRCLLCKEVLSENYVKCPTKCCVGIYCGPCFEVLQLCSICQDPSLYGDVSDVSEEKDSEEEDGRNRCSKCGYVNGTGSEQWKKQYPVYYSFQTVHNALIPKFQISMDTIIDLNDAKAKGEEKVTTEGTANDTETVTPSILTRLMSHWKKAFSVKNGKSNDAATQPRRRTGRKENFDNVYFFTTTEEALRERASAGVSHKLMQSLSQLKNQKLNKNAPHADVRRDKTGGTCRADSEGKSPGKNKLLLMFKTLKGFGLFRWKMKDGSPETSTKQSTKTEERFKNVYFVDVDRKTGDILRSKRSRNSGDDCCLRGSHLKIAEEVGCFLVPGYVEVRKQDSAVQTMGNDPVLQVLYQRTENNPQGGSVPTPRAVALSAAVDEPTQSPRNFIEVEAEKPPQITSCRSAQSPTRSDPMCPSRGGNIPPASPTEDILFSAGPSSRRSSQENLNSSPSSSSDFGAIRKQFADAKRRRSLSRRNVKKKKRRTINAKGRRRYKRCSERHETTSDTSDETKLQRAKRAKGRKSRISIKVTDADLVLTNTAQKVLSKKMEMLKAKLAKFFRKSIKKHSTSDDIGTTENEEYPPMATPPLSEDEFQDANRKHRWEAPAPEHKHCPCAPDLLSDLPTAASSSWYLPASQSQANTDWECDGGP